MQVTTGSAIGSGTDDPISVNLTGEKGSSGMLQLKTSNHHHKFQRSQSDRAHLLQANACSIRISLCPPDAMLMQADCSQAWVPSACAAHTSHVLTRAIDEYAYAFRSVTTRHARSGSRLQVSLALVSRTRPISNSSFPTWAT
jgi:hypothetical protein